MPLLIVETRDHVRRQNSLLKLLLWFVASCIEGMYGSARVSGRVFATSMPEMRIQHNKRPGLAGYGNFILMYGAWIAFLVERNEPIIRNLLSSAKQGERTVQKS